MSEQELILQDDEFGAPPLRDREPAPTSRPVTRVPRESEITTEALRWLNRQFRTFAWKIHTTAMGQTGHPDIDACVDGRSVKIEMKRPGRRPEPHQLGRLRRWQAAGALVGWASTLEHVQQLHARAGQRDWVNSLESPGAP